jgi:hypothetical protein
MIPKPMNDFEQGDRGFASPAGCSVVALSCRELFFQSVLQRVTSTFEAADNAVFGQTSGG